MNKIEQQKHHWNSENKSTHEYRQVVHLSLALQQEQQLEHTVAFSVKYLTGTADHH